MKTLFITNNPDIALHAELSGVGAILIDMEVAGKAERQGHLDTHKAAHSLADVETIAPLLTTAELMVRINPPSPDTAREVRDAASAGAGRIMLPMFRTVEQVAAFKRAAGKTPVTLLVETATALARLPAILKLLDGDDHVHFGLNDLCLDMNLSFLFEIMAGRMLDTPAMLCKQAGRPFGIGGVGRVGQGHVPAEWILGEHVRLGSRAVILSRVFHENATNLCELTDRIDLPREITALQRVRRTWADLSDIDLEDNHKRLAECVSKLVRERAA